MSLLSIHTLTASKKKNKKRVGRGNAGKGTYCGRGIKGQRARSGGKSDLKRRALTERLMKLPQIHGITAKPKKYYICNLKEINKVYNEGDIVSPKTLYKKGLIKDMKKTVKILGTGELDKKLVFEKCVYSYTVRKKIEQSGSKIK